MRTVPRPVTCLPHRTLEETPVEPDAFTFGAR
jgi:hypothetical protein